MDKSNNSSERTGSADQEPVKSPSGKSDPSSQQKMGYNSRALGEDELPMTGPTVVKYNGKEIPPDKPIFIDSG